MDQLLHERWEGLGGEPLPRHRDQPALDVHTHVVAWPGGTGGVGTDEDGQAEVDGVSTRCSSEVMTQPDLPSAGFALLIQVPRDSRACNMRAYRG
jgi:hypothetical protein